VLKISYKILTVVVFMLFAMMSRAENSFLVKNVSCSGTSTQSFLDVLSFTCAGDLSLDGGSISANTSILLSAEGALSLNNLTLTSQDISLIGGTLASAWSDVDINAANSLNISIPDIDEGSPDQPIQIREGNSLIYKDIRTLTTINTDRQFFIGSNAVSFITSTNASLTSLTLGLKNPIEGILNGPIQAQGGSVLILKRGEVVLDSTGMQLYPSANISVVSSVPEPDSYALLLLGVLLVILASRSKVASPQRMVF
jgi:hypothetical protein